VTNAEKINLKKEIFVVHNFGNLVHGHLAPCIRSAAQQVYHGRGSAWQKRPVHFMAAW
jgi:hypothetical protein